MKINKLYTNKARQIQALCIHNNESYVFVSPFESISIYSYQSIYTRKSPGVHAKDARGVGRGLLGPHPQLLQSLPQVAPVL